MDRRQEFISSLVDVGNRVQEEEGEECMICKEEYGLKSSETGTAERKIRLPCNGKHTLGSGCMATWLQEHNTCPICRQTFFEIDYRETEDESHVVFVDEDEEGYWDDSYEEELQEETRLEEERQQEMEDGLKQLQNLCGLLCDAVGFQAMNDPMRDIASQVAERVWYGDTIQYDTLSVDNFNLAAACVYMASHLTRQRLRMRDIAHVSPLTVKSITEAYQLLDSEADDIVDEELCLRIGTSDWERVFRRLPKLRDIRELETREREAREMEFRERR